MLELFKAGGLLMWPLLLCSILSTGIIIERAWTLRRSKIVPPTLIKQIWQWEKENKIDGIRLQVLRRDSPLGRILAAGLVERNSGRDVMKRSLEDTGRHTAHELGRFLNTLGTMASVTPLLGLLGTVVGMIKVFAIITSEGVGDPAVLAEGISEALITTATGLSIAIPTLAFYRYYSGRVEELVVAMEQDVMRFMDALHARRSTKSKSAKAGAKA